MTMLLPNLKERFKTLVGNLANTPHQHVDKRAKCSKVCWVQRLRFIRVLMVWSAIGRLKSPEIMRDYCGWPLAKIKLVDRRGVEPPASLQLSDTTSN